MGGTEALDSINAVDSTPETVETLGKTLQWLYRLERFGVKLGLEETERLLAALGNPHKQFKSIHVAGTNGKGSVSTFLASVLREAGYVTGLYTSPHFYRFNERIDVGGVDISDEELCALVLEIRSVCERESFSVTFFEFTTALAFLYFARKGVEYAVVEVGLGGRLDATNVILPLVSVITTLGLDHVEHLGGTLHLIAREKAGIIKAGVPLVTGVHQAHALRYLEKRCLQGGCVFYSTERFVTAVSLRESLESQTFTVSGKVAGTYTIPLLGSHQIENARVALLTVSVLRDAGVRITEQALARGLSSAQIPGRLTVVSHSPLVLLDGAHNGPGMRKLREYVKRFPKKQRQVLVLGFSENKDIPYLAKQIAPFFTHVIVTQGSFKPASVQRIANEVRKHSSYVYELPVLSSALEKAQELVSADGLLLVTGSLYLIPDAAQILSVAHDGRL